MGWNYLSIPKRQQCILWSLGMDKLFHPILYNGCNNLSIQVSKIIHANNRSHWGLIDACVCQLTRSTVALTLVHCKAAASIFKHYYRLSLSRNTPIATFNVTNGLKKATVQVLFCQHNVRRRIHIVKPVYNDHLYDKIYYLWFIQSRVLMKTEGTNLSLLTISAFWSSCRWP